jgi:Spy/CpxP family protein refolding chaperone
MRIFFFGLVIAVAGALAQSAWAQPFGHDGGGPGFGPMAGPMMGRMLDAVSATPEQRTRIQEIVKAARADMRTQREGARALHDQALQLFTQPTVDASAAEVLRKQMLARHDQASQRIMQAMLDVSAVLTPAQRVQLADRIKQRREMMQRHRSERESLNPVPR